MLSSDKSVETIAQLIEVLKNYIGLQKEYVKLDVIDKVVRLVTAIAIAITFIILGIAVLLFLSFAIVGISASVCHCRGVRFQELQIVGRHFVDTLAWTVVVELESTFHAGSSGIGIWGIQYSTSLGLNSHSQPGADARKMLKSGFKNI
jgi:hypothetical protein